VFVVVCLIKLLPTLSIPAWLYGWIRFIALVKVVNIISGFAVQKRLVAVHSVMNKATGTLLFLLPLTIPAVPLKYSAIVVCAAAAFAAIQEGHFIRAEREWQPGLCRAGTRRKSRQRNSKKFFVFMEKW